LRNLSGQKTDKRYVTPTLLRFGTMSAM
jgi:hypothetical protein